MSSDGTAHIPYGPRSSHAPWRWFWYWGPVGCYAGLIFYLSSLSFFPETLPSFFRDLGDKSQHMVAYGVFGILWYRAFRFAGGTWSAPRAVVLAIVASALYGVTDEIHQYFVPMRQADVWDVVADAAGATIAAVSCEWWFTRRVVAPPIETGS